MTRKKEEYNLKSFVIPEEPLCTSLPQLDYLLGGGIEPGNIIQLISDSGMGKSSIALRISHNLCSNQMKVIYLDTEGSVSNNSLEIHDLQDYIDNNFYYFRENTFQKCELLLDKCIEELKPDLIIIDSIACMLNEGFIEGNVETRISVSTNNANINSRPLTFFFNKYNALAKKHNIAFLITNQYRNSVSINAGTIKKSYGGKNTVYNSDSIIKIEEIKKTDYRARDFCSMKFPDNGKYIYLSVIKSNKTSPETCVPVYLKYGRGIDNVASIIYAYIKSGIIESSNYYYKYKGGDFHGIKELYTYIQNNPPLGWYDDVYNNCINFNKE